MTQETSPKVPSPLDSLVDKAAKESAEHLARGRKITALGVTAQNLQPNAKRQLEHFIAMARETSRHVAEMLAEHKVDIGQRVARHADNPNIQQIKEHFIKVEENTAKILNDTLTRTMTSIFVNLGVSAATTKEIINEIAKQEAKVVAFPKK